MHRTIIYPGQQPLETDLLSTNKYAMQGVGFLAQAMLGTGTYVDGLACAPTAPASLSVTIAPGSIYSLQNTDNSPYSSLGSDGNALVKQGILAAIQTLALTAPGTAGQSVNWLISAAFVEQDVGLVDLPYYDSSNPSQPYSGPNNSGTSQATERQDLCQITATAGAAAATGTQTTPAVPTGSVGIWVVTVAYGQTTITSGNIAQFPNAPFITPKLSGIAAAIQAQAGNYALDYSGTTTGAYAILLTNFTGLTAGMPVRFKATNANTGAATLTVTNAGGGTTTTVALVRQDGSPLKIGDIAPNQIVEGEYESVSGSIQIVPNVANQGFRGLTAITSSGTYTVPAGVTKLKYRVFGGGGGGGACLTGAANTSAGGGAAGGYSEGYMAVTPGQTISATIGAAGTAGSSSPGGAGGNTTFGGVTANGGLGGSYANTNPGYTQGAQGGNSSGGTLNTPGANGRNGSYANFGGTNEWYGGYGADSPVGQGGLGGVNGTGATAATGYASGGAGGSGGSAGTAGTQGLILIET